MVPITALLPLSVVASLAIMGVLLGYAVICAAVLILRRTRTVEPSFRTPLGPVVPCIGILTCLVLMLSLPGENWLWMAAWMVFGSFVYMAYGRRCSVLRSTRH